MSGERECLSDKLASEYQARYVKKNPWVRALNRARTRCNCKTHKAYPNYGGRGIKCLLSLDDIKFLWHRHNAYKMKRPSIDRIDSNGDYTFNNCRFIELSENISRSKKHRPVFRISSDGLKVWFRSMYEAKQVSLMEKGIIKRNSGNSILAVLNGKQKAAYGYKWIDAKTEIV